MTDEQARLIAVHLFTDTLQPGEMVVYDNNGFPGGRGWWGEVVAIHPETRLCSVMIHGRIGSNYPVRWGMIQNYIPFDRVEPMRGRE